MPKATELVIGTLPPQRNTCERSAGSSFDKELAVLWIDDELTAGDAVVRLLEMEGVRVDVATSGATGIEMARKRAYGALIVDLRLGDMFGMTVLDRIRSQGSNVPFVFVTGCYSEPELYADAMRRGAAALLYKPIYDLTELLSTLHAATDRNVSTAGADAGALGIVASSWRMRELVEELRRIAPSPYSVLITGETGTGKELVARAVHQLSGRPDAPFVALNCAAICEGLAESELFGHKKGAFTGATADKPGLLEAAHGGTLFLDEIGDLALPMQARLLRCLDDHQVRRLGETRTRAIDVRVVAATHRNLTESVKAGTFREDLFYRLCVVRLHVPALRDRLEDLEPLQRHCWRSTLQSGDCGMSPEALALMRSHDWPGNVRELLHVFERAFATSASRLLTVEDVQRALKDVTEPRDGPRRPVPPISGRTSPDDARILRMLEALRWNRSEAARSLGINRTTIWRTLKRLQSDK